MTVKEMIEVLPDGEARFNLFPKQTQFINSDIEDILFGGAAGPGKSAALMAFAAIRRLRFPGSMGITFRRTFRELEGSLIIESQKIYPRLGAKYNENKKQWKFPNGSIQMFGYCEADGDVYHHQTNQYHDICFDELTHFTEFQFTYLTSRCRSTMPGCKPLIRSASNPGNVGHHWVYMRYIKPYERSPQWTHPETKKTMAFIPARIDDNPALMESDPGYMDRLKELPDKKYLALAEGRWDVFEGAYFTEWKGKVGYNILPYVRVPDSYTRKFLSLDWGFADPACVLWFEITPMGRVFIYRELYETKLSPKELAKKILEMSPEGERYDYLVASPEIWGKKVETENGGEPIQELIQSVLGDRIVMQKANNARVPGWLKMREYFMPAPDGLPWMQVSPVCYNLIRTIPTLVHEDKNGRSSEDVDSKCEDHAPESCRYGVVSLRDVPRAPLMPHMSNYEKIFGRQDQVNQNISAPMMPGRSGYGF